MTKVPLAEIPRTLEPAFAAGDPAAETRTRERANVDTIGRMVHAIAHGRYDEVREHLAPDVDFEIVAPACVPWRRHARGADEVAATIAENFACVREQRTQPLSLVAQGDTVMVMAREAGCFVDDGEPYEVMLAQQFTFGDDGRLVGFRSVVGEIGRPVAA